MSRNRDKTELDMLAERIYDETRACIEPFLSIDMGRVERRPEPRAQTNDINDLLRQIERPLLLIVTHSLCALCGLAVGLSLFSWWV